LFFNRRRSWYRYKVVRLVRCHQIQFCGNLLGSSMVLLGSSHTIVVICLVVVLVFRFFDCLRFVRFVGFNISGSPNTPLPSNNMYQSFWLISDWLWHPCHSLCLTWDCLTWKNLEYLLWFITRGCWYVNLSCWRSIHL
jgi:hypothetical protein